MTTISPGSDARAPVAVVAAEHAALDLAADDRRLDDDLRVVHRGGRDRGRQVGQVGHPGDAQAGPGARRLDEQRQPQLGDAVAVTPSGSRSSSPGSTTRNGPTGRPWPASTSFIMCLSMPTADASTPAPDVPHVGQLEQALQRAVLAERAVQQREHDVDLAEHARQLPGLEHLDVAVVDRLREQHVRRRCPPPAAGAPSVIAQRSGSSSASTQRPAGVMPTASDVVAVAVDRAQHAAGGRAADRVLAGAAAEQDHHAGAAAVPGVCPRVWRAVWSWPEGWEVASIAPDPTWRRRLVRRGPRHRWRSVGQPHRCVRAAARR